MLNFLELKHKVSELTQHVSYSSAGVATYEPIFLAKVGTWLQLSHKLLAEIYDYWIETQDVYNFSSVASRENYPLPNNFDKPFRLFDISNNKKITVQTEEIYFEGHIANIADADTAVPETARIYSVVGTRVEISSSGKTVKAKSSASTESEAITVRVSGYIDSSLLIEDFESIVIPVSNSDTYVAGTKTFYKITRVSKSANTSGYITLADSDGTVLETLAPTERIGRHKVLKLGLIPDATYNYRMLYKKLVPEMVNDYDYPFTECDRYLIFDACGFAWKWEGSDEKAAFAWSKSQEALQVLLNNQGLSLGSDYTHKIVSQWAAAHRQ